ncbi:MAG: spore germination protein [Bacillota bacterium]
MSKGYKSFKRPIKVENLKRAKYKNINSKLSFAETLSENSIGDQLLSDSVEENLKMLKSVFKDCFDIIFRKFTFGSLKIEGLLAYIEGIVDSKSINKNLLHSLMLDINDQSRDEPSDGQNLIDVIKNNSVTMGEIKEITSVKAAVKEILQANCVLFIAGSPIALSLSTQEWEQRSVSEPITESVVRGPMEAFTEGLKTNISLIRKRIKTPELKMEKYEIGRITKTQVVLSYIKGIADETVVDEIAKRLGRIDIDAINDSGELEQLIQDSPFSPFPQTQYSERPDIISASLAEGRITVLVDGSPFALILPAVFVHFLSSSEDYYHGFYYGSFTRVIRYIAFAITLLLPSVYVALTTFHQEMIPPPLLTTLVAARADIPFPAVVEALLMEFTFEILREAGIRLPKPIGQAVSIVGALVIGESAVNAGIASPAMVIIVAFTGITSFVIPKYNQSIAVRLLRFPMVILAGSLGIFGIIMGLLFLLTHMAALRSVGVSYLSPFAPVTLKDWKDTVARLPKWLMLDRPTFMGQIDTQRMKKGLKPGPGTGE